jgi:aldose sugar dehydrogenase
MSRFALRLLATAAVPLLAGPALAIDQISDTEQAPVRVATIAEGLAHPWAIAFLPDGAMLVTERPGNLRLVTAEGEVSEPISGVPEVDARRQGGLLDVALDPQFQENRLVYLSFAEPGQGGNSTAVARAVLNEDRTALSDLEVIFSQQPKVQSTAHFGSRLVFDGQGDLFVTLGDRSDEAFRGEAQELDSHIGTIVRIHPDGSVPDDNPFVDNGEALAEIWSYGHRNIQGGDIHPETGGLWVVEHGPRGGDEVNVIEPGGNFGWPVVSHGVHYDGTPVGTGEPTAPGMIEPIHTWTPALAPSGATFYTGEEFPEWQGNLFVGGLVSNTLARLELDGQSVVHEERLIENLGLRIRDVVQGPDGALYLATDEENGEILRISRADTEQPSN